MKCRDSAVPAWNSILGNSECGVKVRAVASIPSEGSMARTWVK